MYPTLPIIILVRRACSLSFASWSVWWSALQYSCLLMSIPLRISSFSCWNCSLVITFFKRSMNSVWGNSGLWLLNICSHATSPSDLLFYSDFLLIVPSFKFAWEDCSGCEMLTWSVFKLLLIFALLLLDYPARTKLSRMLWLVCLYYFLAPSSVNFLYQMNCL